MHVGVSVAAAPRFVMQRGSSILREGSEKPVSNVFAFKASHESENGSGKHLSRFPTNIAIDAQALQIRPSFWWRLFLSFSAACCLVFATPVSGIQEGQGSHPDDEHGVGG